VVLLGYECGPLEGTWRLAGEVLPHVGVDGGAAKIRERRFRGDGGQVLVRSYVRCRRQLTHGPGCDPS
jgi:hypothetical protein